MGPFPLTIRTPRLDLIAATLPLIDAELRSSAALARLLSAEVPRGWPPGEYDRPAIEFLRARLIERPDAVGWFGWYALLRSVDGSAPILIGVGGYFGPADPEGKVEIGYSVVPQYQSRGFATEFVGALISRAFETTGVERIIAHTFPKNVGSSKVLERCGLSPDGPGPEPGLVRYSLHRPPS